MSRSTAYIHVSVLHCSRSLFQTRLSAIAPALLYLLYPYSRTDSILAIVLPSIPGHIRIHAYTTLVLSLHVNADNKYKDFSGTHIRVSVD